MRPSLTALSVFIATQAAPALANPECRYTGAHVENRVYSVDSLVHVGQLLGPFTDSEDAARQALCAGHNVCSADGKVIVHQASEGQWFGVAVAHAGGYRAYTQVVAAASADRTISRIYPVGPGYVGVTISGLDQHQALGCSGEGEERGCEMDSENFGAHAIDLVIDVAHGRLAVIARNQLIGDVGCDDHRPPTLKDGVLSRYDCAGKVSSVSLAALAPCTHEATEKARADLDARLAAASAKAKAALSARVAEPPHKANPSASAADFIARGRKLTAEKKLDEAIAAFTRAIELDESMLEGLSGRCYAKILRAKGDDLEKAIIDCDNVRASVDRTKYQSARFFSAVSFNVGLAYEKLGDVGNALDAFRQANSILPSEAARKKIAALEKRR